MLYYLYVFVASLLVDAVPFFGPPAWIVMVFFQMKYGLNIWAVLIFGVTGCTIGRYILSKYIPYLSGKVINDRKKEDIEFIGNKLANSTWQVKLFVLLYTMLPLPSTPLFTAAGMARIKAINIVPSFIVGKFISDMLMVLSGDYAARNAVSIVEGVVTWQSISGVILGLVIIIGFLGIDWRSLLIYNKFRFSFKIWK